VGLALVALFGMPLLSWVYFSRLFSRYGQLVWRIDGQELVCGVAGSAEGLSPST